ncbi:MAG: hypothetical protein JWR77_233 [Rhizorhabdus sp.]|nr:hypothetical protein [Rhizorhabdus sp.]
MDRKEVKRRNSLLMGISLALLLGAAAAFFVFALPQNLLERATVFVGLSRLMVQAEPPISPNDRALLAALAGIGTLGVGWVLIDWLLFGRAGMSALIRPREDDYEDDDEGYRPSDPLDLVTPAPSPIDLPMPMINPADARRPLSARTDIGDPPRAPVFAPSPVPTLGRQDLANGQVLPPLDQLFAEAARAPAPPPPPPPPVSIPDPIAAGLLDPTNIFKGLSAHSAIPQPQQIPSPPPLNLAPADPLIPSPEAGFPSAAPSWPPVAEGARIPADPFAPPPVQIQPHVAAPSGPPHRAEGTPDLRMESFPPDLPELAESPFFAPTPPPSFTPAPPAAPVAFVPPPEPVARTLEPVLPAPSPAAPPPVAEPDTSWAPPVVRAPAPAPPPSDMPLEDMLARLERGMEKRRQALTIAAPPEVPAEPQRRPPPAYAAAPAPYRESPPPPMTVVPPAASSFEAPEPWTQPPSPAPSQQQDGDGLLDQPLNVALGVLRNLVRG